MRRDGSGELFGRGGRAGIRAVEKPTEEVLVARLRVAFDLHEAGVRLMRENLRRRHPDAGEEEIERRLVAWLRERPGAEHGDADAVLRPLPPESIAR